jgi:hypothetical protein
MKLFVIALAALFASLAASAYMIHLDGHADAFPAFADHALVVLSKRVSGTPGSELLTIDTPTGRVLWRQKSDHFAYKVFSDNLKELYAVEGQALVCHSRTNGATLWRVDLARLAWPEPDENDNGRREQLIIPFSRKPERYNFEMPVVSRQGFLITRTGVSGAIDCFTVDSQHWALLDRKDRRVLLSGQGEFVTAAMEDMLIMGGYPERPLQHVTAAGLRNITRLLSQKIKDWEIDAIGFGRLLSHSSRYCTFALRDQQDSTTNYVFYDQRGVYDVKNRTIHIVNPVPERRYQLNWVNTDQWILRFTECARTEKSANDDQKAPLPLWIESHDLSGKDQGRLALTPDPVRERESNRYLSFAGVTQKGWFVFVDHTYVYGTNAAPSILRNVRALLIDGNGPKLIRTIDLAAGKQTSTTVQLLADRDALVQVLGALDLPEMRVRAQDHTLTTRLVSLSDGREIWRHDEKVTIRKSN